jgi:hypothetical protein
MRGHFLHHVTGRQDFLMGRDVALESQEFFPLQSHDYFAGREMQQNGYNFNHNANHEFQ